MVGTKTRKKKGFTADQKVVTTELLPQSYKLMRARMFNSSGIGLQFVLDEDIASLAVSRKQSVVEGFLKEKITPVKPVMPKSKVPEHDYLSAFTHDLELMALAKRRRW